MRDSGGQTGEAARKINQEYVKPNHFSCCHSPLPDLSAFSVLFLHILFVVSSILSWERISQGSQEFFGIQKRIIRVWRRKGVFPGNLPNGECLSTSQPSLLQWREIYKIPFFPRGARHMFSLSSTETFCPVLPISSYVYIWQAQREWTSKFPTVCPVMNIQHCSSRPMTRSASLWVMIIVFVIWISLSRIQLS